MSGNNNEEFRRRQQEREIVPDTPTMRSVAIMPPPMPVMKSLQPTPLAKSAPPRVGPTISISPKSYVDPKELRPKTTPNWRVEQANELPSFYPLERSHVRLSDVTALEVSSRIDECLRKESVAVVYDNKKVRSPLACFQNHYGIDYWPVLTKFFFDSCRQLPVLKRAAVSSSR